MRQKPIGQWLPFALGAIAWLGVVAATLVEAGLNGELAAMLNRPWPQASFRVAGIAALACGGLAMIMVPYYGQQLLPERRPDKGWLAYLAGPVALLLPELWTERGNRYRKRTFRWLGISCLLGAVFVASHLLVP